MHVPTLRTHVLGAASIALVAAVAPNVHAAPWQAGAPLSSGRAQAAIAVDSQGAIHVMGGYGDAGSSPVLTNHEVLGVDGGWTTATPLPTPVRAAVAAAGPDGTIFFAGGYGIGGELGTAWAYGLDGGWEQLPDMPSPAGWETSGDVGADGKLYVFGGEGDELDDAGTNLGGPNSRTLIYDPVGKSWSTGAPMPGRRMQHRVVRGSDGLFYVIGGQDENNAALDTVLVYHPTTNSWTMGPPLTVAPPPDGGFDAGPDASPDAGQPYPINSFAVAPTPDRSFFVVAGGSTEYGNGDAPYFDTVFVFDVAQQTWTPYAVPLPVGRRELVAAFQSCTLSVLGGSNGNAVERHDVTTTIVPLGPDSDGDGMPDTCDADDDNDGVPDAQDCAPKDAAVHPGATEVCDGKDNDCNGRIDDGILCSEPAPSCDGGGACDGGSAGFDASFSGDDSGSIGGGGGDGGGTGGFADDGGGANGDAGGSSGGCGCELVSDRASSGAALLASLGFLTTLARRRRSRRRR